MVSQVNISFAVGTDSSTSEHTGTLDSDGLPLGCQDGSADFLCGGLGIQFAEDSRYHRTIGGNWPVRNRNTHGRLADGTLSRLSRVGFLRGQTMTIGANKLNRHNDTPPWFPLYHAFIFEKGGRNYAVLGAQSVDKFAILMNR